MPKIVTWNMQGGNKWDQLLVFLLKEDIDMICLQECSDLPTRCSNLEDREGVKIGEIYIGTKSRGESYWIAHYEWGTRCNLAIMIKESLCKGKPDVYLTESGISKGTRPILGLNTGRNLSIYCVHTPANKNGSSFPAKWSEEVLYKLPETKNDTWICCGDWNTEPNTMQSTGWSITGPGSATRWSSNKTFDYAIHSSNITLKACEGTTMLSDHSLVAFEF